MLYLVRNAFYFHLNTGLEISPHRKVRQLMIQPRKSWKSHFHRSLLLLTAIQSWEQKVWPFKVTQITSFCFSGKGGLAMEHFHFHPLLARCEQCDPMRPAYHLLTKKQTGKSHAMIISVNSKWLSVTCSIPGVSGNQNLPITMCPWRKR